MQRQPDQYLLPLSPARELLFYGARRDWSSPQRVTIEAVLAKGQEIDWPVWLQEARYYRLSQLLYFNFQRQGLLAKLPREIGQQLKSDYLQTHGLNLAYYSELKQVLAFFQGAGIDSLVLKGAALAPSLYHDPGLRSFGDLDLLLRAADIEKASALLAERYQPDKPQPVSALARSCYFHRTYLRRQAPQLSVELHWGLFSATTPLELDLNPFWQEPQAVSVAECHFFIPRQEYLFLHLCLHFSGHYFLSWRDLWDIDWFSGAEPSLDWGIILEFAERHYLEARLYYPLVLAQRLLGTELPGNVLKQLSPQPAKEYVFWRLLQQEKGVLAEPARANKDLRGVLDLLLLAPHQVLGFYRRLCWPGIAWLTIFPDSEQFAQKGRFFQRLLVFLRGLRLLVFIGRRLLRASFC